MQEKPPSNHENPPLSPFKKGEVLLPFAKGGGEGFEKAIFHLLPGGGPL
jgi:hypothetical protein